MLSNHRGDQARFLDMVGREKHQPEIKRYWTDLGPNGIGEISDRGFSVGVAGKGGCKL
jgi:hypothetical protein